MKKKPELFKRTGNSALALRNFLNNLKENDLHYENKQITQCVFLGVLRLKPVPTIFSSNNVPSVSARKEDNRSKRIKNNNSNKELNKNVSKKNYINKVLSSKVTKKSPQKVKAAIKKGHVKAKKSNPIKIKLTKDKKIANHDKKMIQSPANDARGAISISPESSTALQTLTPDAIIARPTITLNTIISPTKFNPVQSLFDKLKQKIDEGYSEPGPSTTVTQPNKTKEELHMLAATPKVCKITAKSQGVPMSSIKKSKKTAKKKHDVHKRLTDPTQSISPITISDTESTGIKDKDDVIVIEDSNLLHIQDVSETEHTEEANEDIIFVNDDSNLKPKGKALLKKKSVSPMTEKKKPINSVEKHTIIVINEQQKLVKSQSDHSQTLRALTKTDPKHHSEVIVISDESKSGLSNICENINANPLTNENSTMIEHRDDVIIIEEVREIRMSPRSRKVNELQKHARDGHTSVANSRETRSNEVICIADDPKKLQTNLEINRTLAASNEPKNCLTREVLLNKSNSEQLNIAIEEQRSMGSRDIVTESLVKIIGKEDKSSVTIKKELVESRNDIQVNVTEKPRLRKNKLNATLIPPMLLNTPMLLRSELAPKKANSVPRDKPKPAKTRQKSISKLEVKNTRNFTTKSISYNNGKEKNTEIDEAPPRSHRFSLNQYMCPKEVNPNVSISIKNNTSRNKEGTEEIIFVSNQEDMTNQKRLSSANLSRRETVKENVAEISLGLTKQNSTREDINVLTEITRHPASRLLRSDLHQRKTPEILSQSNEADRDEIILINSEGTSMKKTAPLAWVLAQNSKEISAEIQIENRSIDTQKEEDVVVILDEIESSEKSSPRLLRSDITKKKLDASSDEMGPRNDSTRKIAGDQSPRLSSMHTFNKNITETHDTGTVSNISNLKELQTTVGQNVESAAAEVDDQIIVVNDDTKPNETGSLETRQTTPKNKLKSTEDISIEENESTAPKIRTSPRVLRAELAQQKNTSKSSRNDKPIDLDKIVVDEHQSRKTKDKSSERLLRSDLARQSLPVEAEVAEVVVLIHDEPKHGYKTLKMVSAEPEQKNKNVICIDEIIVVAEEATGESVEGSSRSPKPDAEQNNASVKTPPRILSVENDTRKSPSRLLRSSHSPKQILVEPIDKQSNQISPRLRSEINLQVSPQNSQGNKIKEGKPVSPRLLRSDDAQNIPKEEPTVPDTSPTASKKLTASPRSLRSDNALEVSPEILPTDQLKSYSTGIKLKIRKPVSSRLRRSEPNFQEKQLHCNSPEETSKKKMKSPASKEISLLAQSKAKLKTPMLLRSELAQLKFDEFDCPSPEEKDIQKKKSRRSKLRLLPNVPVPKDNRSHEAKPSIKPKRKCLIDDLKKKKSANLQQISNSDCSPILPTENHKPPSLNCGRKTGISTVVDVEEVKMEESSVKSETVEEATPNKSKATRKKTTNKKVPTETVTAAPDSNDLAIISETSPKKNRKRLTAKRKLKTKEVKEKEVSPEKPREKPIVTEAIQQEICINSTKKVDTTVFDFDESEPEVIPLRLNSSPKRTRNTKIAVEEPQEGKPLSNGDITPKPKKQKVVPDKVIKDNPKTKAQAKAKLIAMFHEKSPQKDMEMPETPLKDKSTKKKISKIKNAHLEKTDEKSLTSSSQNIKIKRKSKNSEKKSLKSNVSPAKSSPKKQTAVNDNSKANTSPMKQTTIRDMFSKATVKKETTPVVDSIFQSNESVSEEESAKENTSDNTIIEMAQPKRERKVSPPSKNEDVDEEDMYDDDSDCESRIEWMPEEYAEYKFKYSAKKMMSYKPIHKCKICLLILPSYYRLSKHKKEHSKNANPYNCTQCEQAFPSIEDLTAHLRIHKGKHPYTCKKCDIGFWSKKSLDAHTPIHVLKKVKQPNKRFRCDVCAKEFSKLCDMERHTRVHTGEKPCVCNICNKRFQQSHNLSKHLLTHLHVKPYHCEICNKQFGRNDVLNRHLLTHSVDKPLKCPLCPKGFIRQTQLNNHMTKNHPNAAKIRTNEESNAETE